MIENMRRGEWRRHVSIAEAMRYEEKRRLEPALGRERSSVRHKRCFACSQYIGHVDEMCIMERQFPTRGRK